MYIYTKIEIQTNTHIPITPSPLPTINTQQLTYPHTQSAFTQKHKNEVGIPYPLLLPQMKRIRLMYETVKGIQYAIEKVT